MSRGTKGRVKTDRRIGAQNVDFIHDIRIKAENHARGIVQAAQAAGAILWAPRKANKPQTKAFHCKADRLFYGGAAGGGKSDLGLGLAITAHTDSIIYRREYPQLQALIQRSRGILRGTLASYNISQKFWKDIPGGRTLEFGAVQFDKDVEKFQGRPHDFICVAKGEPVLMADGSSRAIEQIKAGDYVETLLGPRQVKKSLCTGRKDCCSVITPKGSVTITWDHKLLTPSGWVSPEELLASQSCVGGNTSELYGQSYSAVWPQPGYSHGDPRPKLELLQQTLEDNQHPEACALLVNDRSDFSRFDDEHQGSQPLAQWFCYEALLLQFHHEDLLLPALTSRRRAPNHALSVSLTLNFQSDYQPYLCSCDEQSHLNLEVFQAHIPSQAYAEELCQMGQIVGDLWRTPGHSHSYIQYPHPYTKVSQDSVYPCHVQEVEIRPAGVHDVHCLIIDEASHFISSETNVALRNCFDEITHFTRSQFEFLTGWNRISDRASRDQRCRIVCTGNPPVTPEGRWVVEYWAPWLDSEHELYPYPHGELIWFVSVAGEDKVVSTGNDRPPDYVLEHGDGKTEVIEPHSRTFIPSTLEDNPDLAGTNYRANLQALPEPLRSQMLFGDFGIGIQDDPWQVFPSAWIEASFERHRKITNGSNFQQTNMGVDVARGGVDNTILAIRRGAYIDPLIIFPGSATPDGPKVAAQILKHYKSGIVNIDASGVGGSPFDSLNGVIPIFAIGGGETSLETTRNGNLGFFNRRAEMLWKLREMLDPDYGVNLALPPDNRMKAELCAYKWEVKPPSQRMMSIRGVPGKLLMKGQIKVTDKEVIADKLGRSPDRADAVIMTTPEAPQQKRSSGQSAASW